MRQTAGFSKYAVAFSDNTVDSIGGIEGPEELIEFLVKNKQKKTQPQKTSSKRPSKPTTQTPSGNKSKETSKTEGRYNEGDRVASSRSSRPRRGEKPLSPKQPNPNVDSPNHELAYEHQKGARPMKPRGRDRNSYRGAHQVRNAEIYDAKHRVYDRHSGMTKTSVKPSTRTHGRDDFDIKNTVENEIIIDGAGHVNVNPVSFDDFGETPDDNVVQQEDRSTRPGRGGARQSRGGYNVGRDRFINSRRGNNSGEFRPSRPRGERAPQPGSSSNSQKNIPTQPNTMSPEFMLNEKDFPSFDA